MKRLTKDEAIDKFRRHWEWIGMGNSKHDFPDFWIGESPYAGCYLCEFNNQNSGQFCGKNCIIDWGSKGCEKLYILWRDLRDINVDPTLSQRLAQAISELSERKFDEFR